VSTNIWSIVAHWFAPCAPGMQMVTVA
jgi:hypothetical protein